jgi:protoglobin
MHSHASAEMAAQPEALGSAPLVTPGFHPLANFAAFGDEEAWALAESVADPGFVPLVALTIERYLTTQPDLRPFLGSGDPGSNEARSEPQVNRETIEEWLRAMTTGPYDDEFANMVRKMTHAGGGTTFPGLDMPLPPQMVLALIAWTEGMILDTLAATSDPASLSWAGAAWMNMMMLQLGIMLEPCLEEPDGPLAPHGAAEFHPFADLAGFGRKEARILAATGPLLEPAAGGVIALAYDYLLSRPESRGYFEEHAHLAQRKKTLKAWWIRTTSEPMDASFADYMHRVADAHVKDGGTRPTVVIPPQLTIALMGWVQMRVMTALNTVASDGDGGYVFGILDDDAGTTAEIGRAWMQMLALQLGLLLEPYLATWESRIQSPATAGREAT